MILEDGKVKREELFVISKVKIDEVEDIEASCRKSLETLKVEYLDLFLLHWPIAIKIIKEPNGTEPG